MSHYQLTTLDNGLRVVTEEMCNSRSVSVGCWVATGSRDEQPGEGGASHFLEHLSFKGTEGVPARFMLETLDEVGANFNAYASRERTCLWAEMVDSALPTAMGIMALMLQRPTFRNEDIDSERKVILEEIEALNDNPHVAAIQKFQRTLLDGHPLGQPRGGTPESVASMTRETIRDYWERRYSPLSTVISVAGNATHIETVELVEALMGGWEGEETGRVSRRHFPKSALGLITQDIEQAHLAYGGGSVTDNDDRRWAVALLNNALSAGMSSRLNVAMGREPAVARTTGGSSQTFSDAGSWMIYVNTTPGRVPEVMERIDHVLNDLVLNGVTNKELEGVRGLARASMALQVERSHIRMQALGTGVMEGREPVSMNGLVESFCDVDQAQIAEAARLLLTGPKTLAAVGPFQESDLEGYLA